MVPTFAALPILLAPAGSLPAIEAALSAGGGRGPRRGRGHAGSWTDPGVFALARRGLAGWPICASVGLSALNPEDARAYRELGADAVVLPSAVRPDEIPSIKKASGLRIEVFAYCRPEFLLHGKCGLTGYAVEGPGGGAAAAN